MHIEPESSEPSKTLFGSSSSELSASLSTPMSARTVPPIDPEPLSLEQELETEDFAVRGLHRMIDLADYISSLVDGRTTGLFVTKTPEVYTRLLGLASAFKAAAQWYQLDAAPRPKFVAEAERYLAEQPLGVDIIAPKAMPWNHAPISMRSGPVVAKRGGRGAAGRQEEVTKLKDALVKLIRPISPEDLHDHQQAYRADRGPLPREGWVLAWAIADAVLFRIPNGALAEMFREQGFVWKDFDIRRLAAGKAAYEVLEDADLSENPADTRADGLNELAEELIKRVLHALGVTPDQDFFRRRRS
jgi:hypothetical protein